MPVPEYDTLTGSADNVGAQVDALFRDDDGNEVSKVITVLGADAAELSALLDELGTQAEDMTLEALKGMIQARDLGFEGTAPDYAEPCFCAPDEWCSHNLPVGD